MTPPDTPTTVVGGSTTTPAAPGSLVQAQAEEPKTEVLASTGMDVLDYLGLSAAATAAGAAILRKTARPGTVGGTGDVDTDGDDQA